MTFNANSYRANRSSPQHPDTRDRTSLRWNPAIGSLHGHRIGDRVVALGKERTGIGTLEDIDASGSCNMGKVRFDYGGSEWVRFSRFDHLKPASADLSLIPAALAAVEPIVVNCGWQSIDTAPKTPQQILLMPGRGIYHDVIRAPVVGHWCEHHDCWVSWETGRTIERAPVAWMAVTDMLDAEEEC